MKPNTIASTPVPTISKCCNVWVLLSTFFLHLAAGQSNALLAQTSSDGFKAMSVEENGIPFNQFVAIVQDRDGFIWLSTNEELIKYDGYEVKTYRHNENDSNSLLNNRVGKLFLDTRGILWAGHAEGISRYRPSCDCFANYPLASVATPAFIDAVFQNSIYPESKNAVFAIAEDNRQQIWAATAGGILYRYNSKQDVFTAFETGSNKALPPLFINALLAGEDDHLWIGAGRYKEALGSGLIRLNTNSGVFKHFKNIPGDTSSLADSRVSALLKDRNGKLLVGTYNSGLHVYQPETERFSRLTNNYKGQPSIYPPIGTELLNGYYPPVTILHQDQKGGYWVGTLSKGIYHFEHGDSSPTQYDYQHGLSGVVHNYFGSFFEDRQGQIWMGALNSGGLYKKDNHAPRFTWYPSLKRAQRSIQSRRNPDIFWISTMGEGLKQLNRKTGEIKTYLHDEGNSKSLGHNWVRGVWEDKSGNLWLALGDGGYGGNEGGKGGIDRLNIQTSAFEHFAIPKRDQPNHNWTVYALYEDKQGRLWFDTGPGGIYRSDPEKQSFQSFIIPGTENSELWMVVEQNSQSLWVTDYTQRKIYRYYEPDDRFELFVEGYAAEAIWQDETGIWMPTFEKGLLHIDSLGKQQIFTEKDGLPHHLGADIQSTEPGIYWVATRKGITRFDARGKIFKNDGMPRGFFHPIWLRSDDGQLFFGADEGVVAFYPEQVNGNPNPPQLAISRLDISGKPFLTLKTEDGTYEKMVLESNQNNLTIQYAGLHFGNPASNKYQYRLAPFDADWQNAGTRRSVQYTNLAPGDYTFYLRAANSDGIWTGEALQLHFKIQRAWYTTWWFYTLAMLFTVGFVYWIYRFQLAKTVAEQESLRLQGLNDIKTKLYNNITHEFRTPLTVIQGLAKNLQAKADREQNSAFATPLEMIEHNGQRLLRLVNDMLDLARLESGQMKLNLQQANVIPFVRYLVESFQSLADDKLIDLRMEASEASVIMDYDADKLAMVVANLVSNAIKFTGEGGCVQVLLEMSGNMNGSSLMLSVKDNGIGLTTEEMGHIFDRFYQADHAANPKFPGAGIGLALTKELVSLMDGTITVNSAQEKGTTFTVKLPIYRDAPVAASEKPYFQDSNLLPNLPAATLEALASGEAEFELPWILVIEDNLDVVYYLQTCLQHAYRIIHAANGVLGIEKAIENVPDLIICDVAMPEKDGFEVCATLKHDERTNHIPIIMLTARVSLGDRLKGLEQGADAYLAKPFEKEELLIRLQQLLELRKTLQKKYSALVFADNGQHGKEPEHPFIEKARDIVLQQLADEEFSVDDLAAALHLSRSQLHRKIKALTDMSTAIFIRSIRLLEARKMLDHTDLTIAEIAYRVGFKTPVYFSQVYTKTFGESPKSSRN